MFVYQTECADRVEKALEGKEKWAEVALNLRNNLTEAYEEIRTLKSKLEAKLEYPQDTLKQKGDSDLEVDKVRISGKPQLPPGLRELPPRLRKGALRRAQLNASRPQLQAKLNGGLMPQKKTRGGLKEHLAVALPAPRSESSVQAVAGAGAGGGEPVVAAVVVMACNRPDYLQRTLESVLKVHNPVSGKFPLYVSQDGGSEEVRAVAHAFPQFLYMQHVEERIPRMERPNELLAYYRISEHYRWALTQLFSIQKFPRVIILEDDMELAVDFFDYFEAAANLLDVDESLLAVSSWNDNGQKQFVSDADLLYRSDFFPGLGWMLKRSLWEELAPKWPKAYWDDWLRLSAVRKGRQTIRPEVCRTFNFGEHGSSMGQFFQTHLAPIRLNDEEVDWAAKDLSYLLDVNYADFFSKDLAVAVKYGSAAEVAQMADLSSDALLEYSDEPQFISIARQLGIFAECKDGVPRGAYSEVVTVRYHGNHRVFIVGPNSKNLLNRTPQLS